MNDLVSQALEQPAFVPGVFHDLPAEDYFAIEALSNSGATAIRRSPLHFRLTRTKRIVPTPQMQFGTAVHCGVLEPQLFAASVACAPECDKRTKAGKVTWDAFGADNAGKIILDVQTHARALRCVDAVRSHPAARRLLDGAEREVSLFWQDGQFKVPCKARLDLRNLGGLIDLKTTTDASPDAFAKSIANYFYHAQAAFYFSGCEHVFDATPEFFIFIAVEADEPHAVAVYELPPNAIRAGAHLSNIALERYAEALASGEWKGYPDTIEDIQLPRWALRFDQ